MHLKEVLILLLHFVATVMSQSCTSPTNQCECYIWDDGLSVINCRYKSLTQVPTFTQTGITYDKIMFSSSEETGKCTYPTCNNITNLPASSFANLNVKFIDLTGNAISSFNVNAFHGLEGILEGLQIEGDGVVSPPYSTLSVLQNLRKLHLQNFFQQNMLSSNTNLTFTQLQKLTLNNLKGLTTIDQSAFSSLPSVTEFSIEHVHTLTSFPVPAILALSKLQILTILDTQISTIYGDSLASLNDLKSVNFESNENLRTIEGNAFNGVEDTLEFLHLKQNNLQSSTLSIFQLRTWTKLAQLDIGYNTFATIPGGTFRTMPKLVYLNLQDIQLTSIDNTMFTGLAKLHTLDLGYNRITNVMTSSFSNSPALKELRLNEQYTNNQPIVFAANAFQGIENSLERLFIEKNSFDKNQFWENVARFTELHVLNVEGTGLSAVPDRVFANNTKLQSLALTENSLTFLNQQTFYGPRNTLSSIDLFGNQIESVSKCVFNDFPSQPKLILFGNPLACDCRIIWYYDWIKSLPEAIDAPHTIAGPCSTPPELANKYFSDFDKSDLSCPPGYVEPVCQDLYSTTTTSTTTTSTSTSPQTTTTTPRPKPIFKLYIGTKTKTSITLTWTVNDKTDVTGYRLEMSPSNAPKIIKLVHKAETQYTFFQLTAGNSYYFCLILQLNGVDDNSQISCEIASPLSTEISSTTTTMATTTKPESKTQIGIIVG